MVEDGYDVVAYDSQLYEENVGIQKMWLIGLWREKMDLHKTTTD
jgi:hypothetical protein